MDQFNSYNEMTAVTPHSVMEKYEFYFLVVKGSDFHIFIVNLNLAGACAIA